MVTQIKLTVPRGRITVQLVFSLARLNMTKIENMWLLVCREAVESKLVKLETSRSVSVLSGQSYKQFVLLNYDSIVAVTSKLLIFMTLDL